MDIFTAEIIEGTLKATSEDVLNVIIDNVFMAIEGISGVNIEGI